MSQDELAAASHVAKATIANFEVGKRQPYGRTLDDVRATLEQAGVEFIPENGGGAGVRLRDPGLLRQGSDDATVADLRQGAALLRKAKPSQGRGNDPQREADGLDREADERERREELGDGEA